MVNNRIIKLIYVSILIQLLLLLMASTFVYAETEDGIDWKDYDYGFDSAAASNKPIMMDFSTEWCVYCQQMEETTYKDTEVIEKSKDFVAVYVDGDYNQDLVKQYGVDGYPTIIFLQPDGTEINQVVGYKNPEDFLDEMNSSYSVYLDQLPDEETPDEETNGGGYEEEIDSEGTTGVEETSSLPIYTYAIGVLVVIIIFIIALILKNEMKERKK